MVRSDTAAWGEQQQEGRRLTTATATATTAQWHEGALSLAGGRGLLLYAASGAMRRRRKAMVVHAGRASGDSHLPATGITRRRPAGRPQPQAPPQGRPAAAGCFGEGSRRRASEPERARGWHTCGSEARARSGRPGAPNVGGRESGLSRRALSRPGLASQGTTRRPAVPGSSSSPPPRRPPPSQQQRRRQQRGGRVVPPSHRHLAALQRHRAARRRRDPLVQ